ncbi:AzlD domain-containing protein [Brevibacillus composti]|uniref:AzlD domain-containing protein n=1 Tax=Brevibacillus composti TaxID=2796470 RepID=A0A7T5EN34_9BACL|nr:AzlD domain-containing protein [Brevibacillus composti]QQE75663.1 AzlD domain-containing protein [Brevibacillus composti]QUO42689.1 AzlD domain-containing protein [Brevibacillus composti]
MTIPTLLLFAIMAALTYFSRRAFLRLPSKHFSPRLRNGLSFIPLGIFASLVFPSLFVQSGTFVIQPLFLAASLICLLVMALSKNIFLSFGVSLGVVVASSLGLFPW